MKQAAQRGLTLIETITTLAIAAVMATSAVSGFGELRQRRQLEGVASELANDLQFVRTEAVARNRAVRVSFSTAPGGASCYVIHTGAASACTCASNGAAECVGTAEPIKAVRTPANVAIVPQGNNATSMLYNPVRGTTSPAATIDVTPAQGGALRHVVNILGRVRTCSPAGGLSGYKAC